MRSSFWFGFVGGVMLVAGTASAGVQNSGTPGPRDVRVRAGQGGDVVVPARETSNPRPYALTGHDGGLGRPRTTWIQAGQGGRVEVVLK